jgi:flagellar hook assembly protein FlgD
VTVVFPITVRVAVYNSAGELVKTLLVQEFAQTISSFQLSSVSLTNQVSSTSVSILGASVASWDGTAQNGTEVTNGQYFIKVQSTDPIGVVTTVTQTVNVSRSLSTLSVAVYNETGEVVKHLYQGILTGGANTIQSMGLSSAVISPGSPSSASPLSSPITVLVAMDGGSVTVAWDGTNDQGAMVANGQYYVEASWLNGAGDQTVIRQVEVIDGRGGLPGQAFALPNLLTGGQTTTVFRVQGASGLTLKALIYNVAGELVGTAEGQAGAGEASWNASRVADGFYIAVVDLEGPNGLVGRKTTHLVVRH